MGCRVSGVTRRQVLSRSAAVPLSAAALRAAPEPGRAAGVRLIQSPLRVQPVLVYQLFKRRPQTSWRPWGGLFTATEVAEEKARIGRELAALQKKAGFALEILPLREVTKVEDGKAIAAAGDYDTLISYGASGGVQLMESVSRPDKWEIVFLRHRSGPVYEWYEIVSPRYLRKTVDEPTQAGVTAADVVVDETADLLWRLRALYGLKNTLGRKIVAIGKPSGWGAGGRKAPEMAQQIFKMDLAAVSYEDLGARLTKARAKDALVADCRKQAGAYLAGKGVKLETGREFVENAFLLTQVFRDILADQQADAITVNNCMSTIMPLGQTTACLPLSLLNDEGVMAFCESDFVVIPSGVLLHNISGLPVFLNDPTTPHHGLVTLAHCTAPRKLDGRTLEPVRVLTHFESDYGASPKVEMKLGQKLTNIVPDFNFKQWTGFEGDVVGNPFLPICRSQIDVGIKGSCEKLLAGMKGFHWMTGYGNYLDEIGYALSKVGIEWTNLSKTA